MPRTFLVDGSALAYRSFFAPGPGPAYAYSSSLLALLEKERPDYALVAMDTPDPTFRHERFEAYKATRQKTPDELVQQLPLFERIAASLGFPTYALPGWEADDVIGTLAVRAERAGHEVFIVTGDKDFMQIVSEQVRLYNPTRPGSEPVVQGLEAVRERFGCRPDQVVDVLALMGDSSDNIPGVPGVGPKTAVKLIADYEGLDDIYAHVEQIGPPGVRRRLEAGRDSAYLSRELVTIRLDTPVELSLDDLAYGGPRLDDARRLFVELDFPSLAERLQSAAAARDGAATEPVVRSVRLVDSEAIYGAFLEALGAADVAAIDLETTSLVALEAEIVGLALAFTEHEAWYLPANPTRPVFGPGGHGLTARERAAGVTKASGETPLLSEAGVDDGTRGRGTPEDPLRPPPGSDLARFLEDVGARLRDPALRVVGQNLKYDLLVLGRYGVRPATVHFDTMLASHCLAAHQSQHGLDFLALKHLGVTKIPTSELIGRGAGQISMWDVPIDKVAAYAAEDADTTFRLYRRFEGQLDGSDVEHVFYDIEMPLLRVLQRVEEHGVLVDTGRLAALSHEMAGRLEALTARIHELAGEPFNVESPKQLAEILFEKLRVHEVVGVKRLRKTKTGFSTNAEVLETLAEHPLPAAILEHRKLAKLKGTYVDTLPELVHPVTGRIHTSFNQVGASTGRMSSSDPNLQNIPIRTAEGRRIREAFVAPEGCVLLAADYSQVELRLLAHLTGDAALRETFSEGVDIHRRTAALVFGVDEDAVTPTMRARAKTINFGIIYGMGSQRLARTIHVSVKEAQRFIDAYFEALPDVRAWIDGTRDRAREEGFVETLSGRRRVIENIDSADARLRAAARNVAINTPIQGTAADLIKIAMVRVQEAIDESGSGARMLIQVHDELVFEVPEDEVEAAAALVRERMAGAMTLDVPLVVDTGHGRTWVEAH